MPVQLSRLPHNLVGVGGKMQLLDTESQVAVIIHGQDGYGNWVFWCRKVDSSHSCGYRDITDTVTEQLQAREFEDSEGYPAPDWWYANHDTSVESLIIAGRLKAHWLTIASRYTTEPGIIEEWTEKQQESSMTEEQRKKIDRIVALAERLYPNFDYADMAYDAVMENPDCDEQRVADRLAMAFAFP